MHRLAAGFILGYHGCTKVVAEKLLRGAAFRISRNDYDWLGSGIYFWGANPVRGLAYAKEMIRRRRGAGTDRSGPAVVGAVIDLGLCLDLTTQAGLASVKRAHGSLETLAEMSGRPLPRNSPDLPLRRLDCAVINHAHYMRRVGNEPAVQTVRGVFIEGGGLYPGTQISEKTHIQIAVVDPGCIKGVFRVRSADLRS